MATGNQRDLKLLKLNKVLSENNMNIIEGDENLKISSLVVSRKPVLNDIFINLQVNQNDNQIEKISITKPTTISTYSHISTSTPIDSKENSSLNTSKTVLKVNSVLNENIFDITKVFVRPRTNGFFNQINTGKFIEINKPVVLESESHKKEQEWRISCTVDDVDKSSEFDPFHVGAYCKPIFEYMLTLENKNIIKPDYLANHKYIKPSNRSVVVDWLVEVQQIFNLLQETLYLAVGVFDRYLQQNKNVTRDKLQLVGITSLLLACKYEEMYVPNIRDFIYLSDNSFTKDEVKLCLVDVFRSNHYSLAIPLSLTFLRRFSKISGAQLLQYILTKYFLELALIDCYLAHVRPSKIAASGLLLSVVITNNPELEDKPKYIKSLLSLYWIDVMQKYSTYKMDDLVSTVQALANLALNAHEWKYQSVYKKYLSSKTKSIAKSSLLRSPAMKFIAHA